ncbi:MAG: EamA family transporter [Clostridia bacterium]|nr:EamA family transporter [Clostridia bacterium]
MYDKKKRIKADASLTIIAFIWGITFVTVKNAIADMAPYTFLAFRFGIAFIFMIFFCIGLLKENSKKILFPGILLGVFLFGGYAFQTIGLQYTTVSNAGFITGLSVVIVPLIYSVINRTLPSKTAAVGALCAAVGVGMLSLKENYSFNPGDFLMLMCAFCFALHIVFVGRYVSNINPTLLTTIQIGTVAVISGLAGLAFESHLPLCFTKDVWIGLLTTAIPATALAFFIQNSMQRYTTPMHTAVIFSLEPVFAGMAGYFLLGEVLGPMGLLGAALVFLGMILSEVSEIQSSSGKVMKDMQDITS